MFRHAALMLLLAAPAFGSLATQDTEQALSQIEAMVAKKDAKKAVVDELVDALQDPVSNIRVKERSAWALGELEAQSAVPALIEGAKHKGLLVRSASLNALMRLKAKSALPIFTSIAENDPILSLRQNATLALGLLQSEKTIPTLVKLASDSTAEVRGAVALAMAATQSKKNDFSEALEQMKGDQDPYVQARATRGLEIIHRKNAAVLEQLGSQDADVRLFAATYFIENGTGKELNHLKDSWNGESDEATRSQLAKAIVAVKKRAAQTQGAGKKKAGTKKVAKKKKAG